MFRRTIACLAISLAFAAVSAAQSAADVLNAAYRALAAHDYDTALPLFRKGIALDPDRIAVRKDFAYALLKAGENEEAREQFAAAVKLDPNDAHAALEYAFLCFETGQQAEARRVFDRVRRTGDAESRATAEKSFANIDEPLAAGIARWSAVVAADPDNFSAHEELARLADRRDDFALAAEHYERAWQLRPAKHYLMVELGRVWQQSGHKAESIAILLAASRGEDARTAERAQALLPSRYPYLYEFRNALKYDPANIGLRREYAYQLLLMAEKEEAERQFEYITAHAPDDLLSAAQLGFLKFARGDREGAMPYLNRVLQGDNPDLADRVRKTLGIQQELVKQAETPHEEISVEAKQLAYKSLEAGYLQDAMKYLTIAHDNDPVDFDVMLKLGWTNNVLHNDDAAVEWFNLARRSPDRKIAREAALAYRHLRPNDDRVRFVAWMYPMYSSRWRDLFAYAQAKVEFRVGRLPLRPYLSVRFVGDAKGSGGGTGTSLGPLALLSENSVIAGVGVVTNTWKGLTGWVEAGQSTMYLRPTSGARSRPDYRGGVAFARGVGNMLQGESTGLFADTTDDIVFLSRYDNDVIFNTQNRLGYTLLNGDHLGGLQLQTYLNVNANVDARSQSWANFVESGPGFRFRWKWMPPSLTISANWLRGAYRIPDPRWPAYREFRLGVWYAFSR